jgi:hypothetical protein
MMKTITKSFLYSLMIVWTVPASIAKPPQKDPPRKECHSSGESSFFKDEGIAIKVGSKLQFNKALLRETIDVKSSGGIVTLSGNVSTPEQIELAAKLASEVSGVLCVNNFLKVGPPIKDSGPSFSG